ncbi:MAG: MBL fold metallo-hydrolase [Actinomycetota bacterium]|nr:MBL fold metallo-hydrolase [Actinomycetota bacterium]
MIPEIKITSLIDNSVYVSGLKAEHGLSLFIESGNDKILFDCGQSGQLIRNAENLGIDLKETKKIIISHGHYDHTGGLMDVLKYIGKDTDVFCSSKIFENKLAGAKKGDSKEGYRFVGIKGRKQDFEEHGAVFKFIEQPFEINKNIFLSGAVKRDFFNPGEKNHFFKNENGITVNDDMSDEISLYYFKKEINMIVTGCAHRGIINILHHSEEIKEKSILKDNKKTINDNKYSSPKIIIGGFHLVGENEDFLKKVLTEFRKFKIIKIVPMHCTGFNASCLLKNEYKDKCEFGKTGLKIKL